MLDPQLFQSAWIHFLTIYNLPRWPSFTSPAVLVACPTWQFRQLATFPLCCPASNMAGIFLVHIPPSSLSIMFLAIVAFYADHVSKEIAKMCATKVFYPVHRSSVRFHTPINAVIKNSDKNRARAIANIHITDQESLTRASAFSYPIIADTLRH